MAIGTPFHSRTSPLCASKQWRDWAGFWAASCYDTQHTLEYFAIRNSAALIDISPLHKYMIEGPDALALMNRIVTKDLSKVGAGRVAYTPWCNSDGKVLDDGTISVLRPDRLRVTSAEPNFRWFSLAARNLNVTITDASDKIAALALQGPASRHILNTLCDKTLDGLGYFSVTEAQAARIPLSISRTGYTGDLGFEIWVDAENAEGLWDQLMNAGKGYGLLPAGIYALDMARIEAGYIMADVDYVGADHALIPAQNYSPYEIGLGWTVHLDKTRDFIGHKALAKERERGSKRKLVGLRVDWKDLERLYAEEDLPPQVTAQAWRTPIPVFSNGAQIGVATSGTWSPLLKNELALGSMDCNHATVGHTVYLDRMIAQKMKRVRAILVKLPFFDPARKRT